MFFTSVLQIFFKFEIAFRYKVKQSSEESLNNLRTTDLSSSAPHLQMRKLMPRRPAQGPIATFEWYLQYSTLALLKNRIQLNKSEVLIRFI